MVFKIQLISLLHPVGLVVFIRLCVGQPDTRYSIQNLAGGAYNERAVVVINQNSLVEGVEAEEPYRVSASWSYGRARIPAIVPGLGFLVFLRGPQDPEFEDRRGLRGVEDVVVGHCEGDMEVG